jgi:hypothetical protein
VLILCNLVVFKNRYTNIQIISATYMRTKLFRDKIPAGSPDSYHCSLVNISKIVWLAINTGFGTKIVYNMIKWKNTL